MEYLSDFIYNAIVVGIYQLLEGVRGMVSIETVKREIVKIASAYGIKKANLFGSYADGTATERSDLDLLLEFETHSISIFKLAGIKIQLEGAIGISVDVVHGPLPQNSFLRIDKQVSLYEQ